jgi:hypothetical protein
MLLPAESKEATIHVEHISKGIYFLRVTEKGAVRKTFKLSIE